MKKIITLQLLLLSVTFLFSQTPQQINYQAVVRNGSGSIVANTPVVLRFTILDGSASGTSVYTETSNTLTTNQFGLVNTVIGQNANLATVSWGTNTKWLEVEVSISSGAFVNMGTTQLVSVPYALWAKKAEMDKDSQTLSINGNNLSISNGNTVTLPTSNSSNSFSSLSSIVNIALVNANNTTSSFKIIDITSDPNGNNYYAIIGAYSSTGVYQNAYTLQLSRDSLAGYYSQSFTALSNSVSYQNARLTWCNGKIYVFTGTTYQRYNANGFGYETLVNFNPTAPGGTITGATSDGVNVLVNTYDTIRRYQVVSTALINDTTIIATSNTDYFYDRIEYLNGKIYSYSSTSQMFGRFNFNNLLLENTIAPHIIPSITQNYGTIFTINSMNKLLFGTVIVNTTGLANQFNLSLLFSYSNTP